MNGEPYTFGQLRIEFDGDTPVVHGPADSGEEHSVEAHEGALREWLREDATGRYRPLPTAKTIRPCWYLRCNDAFSLSDARLNSTPTGPAKNPRSSPM
mgnify:CR=1 FL=1